MRLETREDAKTEGGGGRVERAEWGKVQEKKKEWGQGVGEVIV